MGQTLRKNNKIGINLVFYSSRKNRNWYT